MPTTSAPIFQALVQTIRSDATLKAAGIHEGIAPEKTPYPFLVYTYQGGGYEFDTTNLKIEASFSFFVFSRNQVEAHNLDQLVMTVLHDAPLSVSGQSTLFCRRVMDVPIPPDLDEEGKKIYQVGGLYEVWTDQSKD